MVLKEQELLQVDESFLRRRQTIGKLEVYRKERSEKNDREHVEYLRKKHNIEQTPYEEQVGYKTDWMEQKYTIITGAVLIASLFALILSTIEADISEKPINQISTKLNQAIAKPQTKSNIRIQPLSIDGVANEFTELTKKYVVDPQQKLVKK